MTYTLDVMNSIELNKILSAFKVNWIWIDRVFDRSAVDRIYWIEDVELISRRVLSHVAARQKWLITTFGEENPKTNMFESSQWGQTVKKSIKIQMFSYNR